MSLSIWLGQVLNLTKPAKNSQISYPVVISKKMVLYLALLLPQLSKKSSKRRLEDESLPLLPRLWGLLFVNDASTGRSLFLLMMAEFKIICFRSNESKKFINLRNLFFLLFLHCTLRKLTDKLWQRQETKLTKEQRQTP